MYSWLSSLSSISSSSPIPSSAIQQHENIPSVEKFSYFLERWSIKLEILAYIDNDFPSTLPINLDIVEMEFYESERYVINDTFSHRLWDSTNSESGGFIRLGPDMRVFSVAMFHQLHCISRLQQGLKHNDGSHGQYHHIQHCLNYLRQLFLCSADTTLEPGDVLYHAKGGDKDGTSFTRECRDWSAVYDFSDRNLVEFRQFRAGNLTRSVV